MGVGTFNSSDDGCDNVNFNSPSNQNITLCLQLWVLTLGVAPGVCQINNSVFDIPFLIQCVPGVSPEDCPLTAATDTATIRVYVNTDYFCPVLLGSFQFTGALSTYYPDFSAPHTGFFQGDAVGFELDITDAGAVGLAASINGITIIYLAGVLSQDQIAPGDLFLPAIETLIMNPDVQVAILVGGNNSNDNAAKAFYAPDVCSTYPQPPSTGCNPGTLRFEFTLSADLWQVPADEFSNLFVGVEVQLSFTTGLKRIVSGTFATSPQGSQAQTSLIIESPNAHVAGANVVPPIMALAVLSLLALVF